MSHLTGNAHTTYVKNMFTRIAGRYDLLNRLMTFGLDIQLRHEAIQKLEFLQGNIILDAGCGTGDIALTIAGKHPEVKVIGSDLTLEMVRIASKRSKNQNISFVIANAEALPFASEKFSGVIQGYLLRNVSDIPLTLNEQFRILKPEGRIVSLDTTPPRKNIFYPFIQFYLKFIIPSLGKLIARDQGAYQYLQESTQNFLPAEILAQRMGSAGFRNVKYFIRLFGTMAIHVAKKR
jgi:demethylmenaquinone methyltransferase / 2-methoxy-6-polyprenyl-1,4-benzoquinol methylase